MELFAPRLNGWIPDRPDHRDYLYEDLRPQPKLYKALARSWRTTYLHEDNLPRLYNQGPIGSCTGHGVGEVCAYAIDRLYEPRDGKKPVDYSRLFVYYNGRQHKDQDEGAYIREVVKGIAKYGICEEIYWPYDVNKWAVKPPDVAYEAAKHRANNVVYYRIESIGDILDCIAQGFPVVYGMSLFESFDLVGRDGVVPMPSVTERYIGGHCLVIVGASMKKQACYVRNSWGIDWGNNGHCWVPFKYLEMNGDDFWTIRRLER